MLSVRQTAAVKAVFQVVVVLCIQWYTGLIRMAAWLGYRSGVTAFMCELGHGDAHGLRWILGDRYVGVLHHGPPCVCCVRSARWSTSGRVFNSPTSSLLGNRRTRCDWEPDENSRLPVGTKTHPLSSLTVRGSQFCISVSVWRGGPVQLWCEQITMNHNSDSLFNVKYLAYLFDGWFILIAHFHQLYGANRNSFCFFYTFCF